MRLEWDEAYRRFVDSSRDPVQGESLRAQLVALTEELRRRVGGTFTLAELVDEYGGADTWSREALSQLAAAGWPRTLTLVEGAAFHLYSRGAVDYTP